MDLYSDLDGDTNSNGKLEETDAVDLYEDVLVPTGGPPPVRRQGGLPSLPPSADGSGRKYQLYVGNLTWWTSDQDIANAIAGLGIRDLLDVKFFEYRPNGQSKGYCVVTFGSEQSIPMCIQGLPKTILHGNHPVVTYPTKQALLQFEASCKPRATQANSSNQQQGPAINAAVLAPLGSAGIPPPRPPPPVGLPPPHQPPPHWHIGPHHTSRPPPSLLPPRPHVPSEPRLPSRPEWNRPPPPPGVLHPFPPQIPLHRPPPTVHPSPSSLSENSGPRVHAPFYPRGSPHTLGEPHPRGPPPGFGTPPQNRPNGCQPPPVPQQEFLSGVAPPKEADYEEIMARNRTVTSSAIARAVSDAAAGEFASAIETLVTAISLIKHSDTAKDERCRVLISSLQDTLQKVESKSYGSVRKDRSRSREKERFHRRYRRERSRSRERDYKDRDRDREKDRYYESYYRDRSRSRDKEREYREKSREDRYYEDRYRDRERDRDRELRRESDRDREPSRREGEREREPSRREVEREREPSRRESEREREREPSRREGDRERETSRRDVEREREPSRREVERERETSRRESDKDISRREIEEREPSSRDVEKEQSRRETEKELSRREVSRREIDREREQSRRDQDWERESRRESTREQSRRESDRSDREREPSRRDIERDREREKYYKIDKEDSFLRESKAV